MSQRREIQARPSQNCGARERVANMFSDIVKRKYIRLPRGVIPVDKHPVSERGLTAPLPDMFEAKLVFKDIVSCRITHPATAWPFAEGPREVDSDNESD